MTKQRQPDYIESNNGIAAHLGLLGTEITKIRVAWHGPASVELGPEPSKITTDWRDDGLDDGVNGWISIIEWPLEAKI